MSLINHILLLLTGLLGVINLTSCEEYCLQCNNAQKISDCTKSVKCSATEYCFTEEIINANGIIYNAGCKAAGACLKNAPPSGGKKKRSDNYVACSRCCQGGGRNETLHNCNSKLCGLPSTEPTGTKSLAHCYKCDQAPNPESCNDLYTCQLGEICGVQTQAIPNGGRNGTHEYTFGCFSERICLETTKRIIKYREMAGTTGGIGRRTNFLACNICCGGNFCNTGDCVKLFDKLYGLYQTHHLNLTTLQYIS